MQDHKTTDIGKEYLHLISKISKELLEIYEEKTQQPRRRMSKGLNRWLTREKLK